MKTRGWYEEARERQLRRSRERRERDMMVSMIINGLVILAAAIALLVVVSFYCRRPVMERAAYLEGRWGVDHETAMRYAIAEVAR